MEAQLSVDMMSTRDAAVCLGVSVRTVQLWVENGCLDAWKTPGGHRRIYRESVNSMLAARHAKNTNVEQFEILICVDPHDNSSELEDTLKSLGSNVRVRTVTNGYEALIQIGECCPNLLITDLVASNTHGIQMLDALQNTAFMQTMHIVVLTDLSDAVLEKLGGLHPGVTKFGKPVPFAQLLRLARVYMDINTTH